MLLAEEAGHALNVLWGARLNNSVLFNEIEYVSPDLFSGIPLGVETKLKTDETFYFFTFSSYTLSAEAYYRMQIKPEWFYRFTAGFLVSLMPFNSNLANANYAAPSIGVDGGWNNAHMALEWKNRFRFYRDGVEVIPGLTFTWWFHPRVCLMLNSDFFSAVLYNGKKAEAVIDCRLGTGFRF